MLSPSLDTLLKLSKTTYPQKLFANDCVTLYYYISERQNKLPRMRGGRPRFKHSKVVTAPLTAKVSKMPNTACAIGWEQFLQRCRLGQLKHGIQP